MKRTVSLGDKNVQDEERHISNSNKISNFSAKVLKRTHPSKKPKKYCLAVGNKRRCIQDLNELLGREKCRQKTTPSSSAISETSLMSSEDPQKLATIQKTIETSNRTEMDESNDDRIQTISNKTSKVRSCVVSSVRTTVIADKKSSQISPDSLKTNDSLTNIDSLEKKRKVILSKPAKLDQTKVDNILHQEDSLNIKQPASFVVVVEGGSHYNYSENGNTKGRKRSRSTQRGSSYNKSASSTNRNKSPLNQNTSKKLEGRNSNDSERETRKHRDGRSCRRSSCIEDFINNERSTSTGVKQEYHITSQNKGSTNSADRKRSRSTRRRSEEELSRHTPSGKQRCNESSTATKCHKPSSPVHKRSESVKRENRKCKDESSEEHIGPERKRKKYTTADNTCQPERELKIKEVLEKICLLKDKDEAILDIEIEEQYVTLLNSKQGIREDLFKLVIDSLINVFELTKLRTQAMCILLKTYQQFVGDKLPQFILKLSDKKVANDEDLGVLIAKLITLFEAMLQRIGNMVAFVLPILQLKSLVERFYNEGRVKEHIKERLNKTIALCEDVRERAINGDNLQPPNDFREMSVVPVHMDFQGPRPFLRANVVDKAYSDVQHYLDVQFRLLREDFIIPLRDGIKQLRSKRNMPEKRQQLQENIKKKRQGFVYNDVKVLSPVCGRDIGIYRIRINVGHQSLKSVRWEKTKRLKFGALVCLSPDSFNTLFFGAVENRDIEDLKYGELELHFKNCDRQLMRGFIENKTGFQMVESDSYFEAYRHNLRALQQLNEENLPFKEHIVYCNKEIEPPKYLVPEPTEKEDQEKTEDIEALKYLVPDHEPIIVGKEDPKGTEDMEPPEYLVPDHEPMEKEEQAKKEAIEPLKYLDSEPMEEEKQERPEKGENIDIKESSSGKQEDENTKDGIASLEDKLDDQFKYMNLKSIANPEFTQEHKLDVSRVPVLDLNQWPCKEALGLDESQYRACQLALTNRFALIQGPPGTGKTYVGLKIAEALLDNSELWSGENKSPILMVSFTNHALDQFLMGLKNKEGIVRVGGRSREELLTNFNLKTLRKRNSYKNRDHLLAIERKIEKIEYKYSPKVASLLLAQSDKAVLSVKKLEKFIKKTHFNSLKPVKSKLKKHCTYLEMNEELLTWLYIETNREEQRNEQHDRPHEEYFRRMFSSKKYTDDSKEDDYSNDEEEILVIDSDVTYGYHDEHKSVVACQISDAVKPQKLIDNLKSCRVMPEEEEKRISDIWSLGSTDRWRLYRLWRDRLERNCHKRITDCQDEGYETELKKLKERNDDCDFEILRNSRVVGMTTTCAARCHALLQRVKPKIVIVEEAAEVLEAHILTSLPLDCEHVILIGDHQQLRPSCTVYHLAKEYKLTISMFERLVKHGMPCVRLSEQHRMRPEIASLMKHIYKDLHNHTSVNEYKDIRGFQHNVFFIDHSYPEGECEDSHSHFNEHEAKFLVKLCRYIIQQGYKPSQVTILTPYLGQMFKIRDHVTSEAQPELEQIRLTTIDNYQGEENDIILLSLVRSNDTGQVGFVRDINRACVALSRARMSLYVIGNFKLLSAKSDIWKKVTGDLKGRNQIGEALPLHCQSHDEFNFVKKPKDFQKMVPLGGCILPCRYRLDCGHACTFLCHSFDPEHKDFRCLENCTKTIIGCKSGHPCSRKCWKYCESECSYLVDKTLPCGHIKKNVRCHASPDSVICDEWCEKYLSCGHKCRERCSDPCTSACKEVVNHNDWPCGHNVTIACSATLSDCPAQCAVLSCGHECSGSCGKCLLGRVHRRCKKICGRVLVCGHQCCANCTDCPPCTSKCESKCSHSNCGKDCGELCVPCAHQCKWKCEHLKCNMSCGEICDRPRCNEPCRKDMKCGHKCRGLCEESCICVICQKDDLQEITGTEDFDDETLQFIQLTDCKHIFEVSSLDQWVDTENSGPEEPDAVIQLKACPTCREPIRTTMRYNAAIKKQLKDIEKVKEVILGEQQTLHKRRNTLKTKLDGYIGELRTSRTETNHIRKCEKLQEKIQCSKNDFQLTNFENQFKLLEQCRKAIQKSKIFTSYERSSNMTEMLYITSTLNYLKEERIIGCDVERELMDIDLEITRQSLHLEVCCLLKDTKALNIELKPEEKTIFDVTSKLAQVHRIEEPELVSYLKKIEEIRSNYPIINPPTREEKDQIVKAMGLPKGHWYKCRQGHIYAIGDCGGAMERGTCPECRGVIGGASHRLEEGNEVATEMDGARYSAWSEQANMANYDL